jgi:hypothetical protein
LVRPDISHHFFPPVIAFACTEAKRLAFPFLTMADGHTYIPHDDVYETDVGSGKTME